MLWDAGVGSLPFCWEAMGCGLHLLGRRESARRRFPAIFPYCCPVLHCCHALTGEPPCLEYTVFYKGNSTGAAHRQGKARPYRTATARKNIPALAPLGAKPVPQAGMSACVACQRPARHSRPNASVPAPSAACARRAVPDVRPCFPSQDTCTGGADAGHCHAVPVPPPCTGVPNLPGATCTATFGCMCRLSMQGDRPAICAPGRGCACAICCFLRPAGRSLRGPCPCLRVRAPGRRRCRPPSCRPGARPLSPPLPRATVLRSACPGQAPGAPSARPPARPPRPPWRRPNP